MNQTAQVLESARFYIYSMLKKKPKKTPAISAKHILVTQDQQIFQAFQMRDILVSPVNILMFTYNNTYLVRLINNSKLASLLMKVNTFFAMMYNHFPFLKHAINSKLRCWTFTYQVELSFPCSNLQQIWLIFFTRSSTFNFNLLVLH